MSTGDTVDDVVRDHGDPPTPAPPPPERTEEIVFAVDLGDVAAYDSDAVLALSDRLCYASVADATDEGVRRFKAISDVLVDRKHTLVGEGAWRP